MNDYWFIFLLSLAVCVLFWLMFFQTDKYIKNLEKKRERRVGERKSEIETFINHAVVEAYISGYLYTTSETHSISLASSYTYYKEGTLLLYNKRLYRTFENGCLFFVVVRGYYDEKEALETEIIPTSREIAKEFVYKFNRNDFFDIFYEEIKQA